MSYWDDNEVDFHESLIGKTLTRIEGSVGDDEMTFITDGGEKFNLYHDQDCCEHVYIEDICGDIVDLIGSPLLLVEVVTSGDNPQGVDPEIIEWQESFTWTFYKLATIKGAVTIRWYGVSNGYYSESVSFQVVK